MWKIVLSHAWFKCQCILMIPWLSFCNKYQYWNRLSHEDSLSKAELIWLFWKGGHLVSSLYIWIMEMRTQSTFNHNISITFNNMRRRSWIYRRRRRKGMMWTIVLSHTWFKCQCILMIPWLSFCNKHQYWDRLRCEVQLSKTVLRCLFWKGGHLVSSWYIWIMEMRTQYTFNHNISLSLSTISGEQAEYIEEEEGEDWCERLFCLMHDLNANAFWWYHDYHFATSINIGIDSDVKFYSVRLYRDDYSEREVI